MSQPFNCCPHCSADIKQLGQAGICWHCRKPLISTDALDKVAGQLTDSNPTNNELASAKVENEPPSALWQGIGWAVLLPVIVLFALGKSELVGYLFGLIQWLWIVPMMRKARSAGRPVFARGLKIGAWAVFIPYAVVFGLLGGIWILVHIDLTPGHPWFY